MGQVAPKLNKTNNTFVRSRLAGAFFMIFYFKKKILCAKLTPNEKRYLYFCFFGVAGQYGYGVAIQ